MRVRHVQTVQQIFAKRIREFDTIHVEIFRTIEIKSRSDDCDD